MLKTQLTELILETLKKIFPDETLDQDIVVEYPGEASHGDYAYNIALRISKKVEKPPREIAETIVENIKKPDYIQAIEIAGPGFINFFIDKSYLIGMLRAIFSQKEKYGRNESGKGQSVMIEYSSPNTNKPLHLGHARNNFLGMAMANLLEANGYDVTKTAIVNDRGIHICKSMLAYQKFGRDTSPESVNKKGDHFVGDYYVKYSEEVKKHPELEEEAKEMLVKWEMKDPEVRELWEKMNRWVLDGFHETYERIGSHFNHETFESDISESGRAIVEKALKDGKVEEIEGGAMAIDLSDCGLGDSETGKKVLIRSDGTTVYMTQDLQLAVSRMEGGDVDQLIYVVADEQNYHFRVLFEVLKRFGYDWVDRCYHLSYGMVDLPTGKMKSREGTTVDLDNLLDDLEELVDQEITERELPYDGEEREKLKSVVALAALKFFILKVDNKSRMVYDPNSSIDFQGNTGPYLQYTHARIHSILRKTPDSKTLLNEAIDPAVLREEEEIAILRKLQLYPEIVHSAAQDHRIHMIATYLSELAQLTNSFYTKHSVLDADGPQLRTGRLQLIAGVAQVLKNGLGILGIEAPNRM